MSEGGLYIASGEKFVSEAVSSAKSLHEDNDIPVTIVTDRAVPQDCFDSVIREEDFLYHYGDSLVKIPALPYDKTLLLDADTRIYGNIDGLFDILDNFDIAAATISNSGFTLSSDVPSTFPEYNTGVVALQKNPEVESFIQDWKVTYREYLDQGVRMNQPAFRETLYDSGLRISTLPTEYNCRVNLGGYLTNEMKILHGDVDNPDEVAQRLNAVQMPRVYYTRNGEVTVARIETTSPDFRGD